MSAYSGATVIILLAVLVGLFRLLLPQLPEYQLEIQQRISDAAGVDVRFGGLDARWRFSGPELLFRDVVIAERGRSEPLLEAGETVIGAGFLALIRDRKLSVNRIVVRDSRIEIERTDDGSVLIEGRSLQDLLPENAGTGGVDNLRVLGEQIEIVYRDAAARRAESRFVVDTVEYRKTDASESLDMQIQFGNVAGSPVEVEAKKLSADGSAAWNIYVEAADVALADYLLVLPRSWPVPVAGTGSVSLWVDLLGSRVVRSNVNLDLMDVRVASSPSATESIALNATGKFEWSWMDNTVVAGFDLGRLEVDGNAWRPTGGRVEILVQGEGEINEINVDTKYLDIKDLWKFHGWLPEEILAKVNGLNLSGSVTSLDAHLGDPAAESPDYRLDAEVANVSFNPVGALPGLRGLSGILHAEPDTGRIQFEMGDFQVRDDRLFSAPLRFSSATGSVTWRQGSGGLAVLSDSLVLSAAALTFDSNFELRVPRDGTSPLVDLITSFEVRDLSGMPPYLPDKVMRPRLYSWFVDALQSGRIVDGSLVLNGALNEFPFEDGPGTFQVRGRIEETRLKFNGSWPAVDIDYAQASLDGFRLQSEKNSGSILGNKAEDTIVTMENVVEAKLEIEARGRTGLPDALRLVRESPIAKLLGARVADVRAQGSVGIDFTLDYPIRNRSDFAFEAKIRTDGASAELRPLTQRLTEITGEAIVTRDSVNATNVSAVLLGEPVVIELLPAARATGYRAIAIVSGQASAAGIREEVNSPFLRDISGISDYRATVRFPGPNSGPGKPLLIRVESELEGLGVMLPRPGGKPEADARRLQLDVSFPAEGTVDVGGRYTDDIRWALVWNRSDSGWKLTRGNIHHGSGRSVLPVGRGLFIDGELDYLRFSEWLDYVASLELPKTEEPLLSAIDLTVGEAYGYGQRADDINVKLDRNASDWLVQLLSERIAGSIFVPLDLSSGRPLVLQMDKMLLTEADPDAGAPGDPRDYSPATLTAADFALGERKFGRIDAVIEKTERGLAATSIQTEAATFSTSGTGSWEIQPNGVERSSMNIDLVSTDAAVTGANLAIETGIVANSVTAKARVSWDGAPREDLFDTLDGEFAFAIANGQLSELEPGAGRVLGLMSVVELPRRLALDFTDVFSKGLSFDEIKGDYRVVNGQAYTCNLSLQGPTADIALIGKTDLGRRDYNQTAVVSPKVGNTLPAAGFVAAGPQVAAAVFLLQRIFKKPLKDIARTYYQIGGSWDEPSIEKTNVERFNATSDLAGCLQNQQ